MSARHRIAAATCLAVTLLVCGCSTRPATPASPAPPRSTTPAPTPATTPTTTPSTTPTPDAAPQVALTVVRASATTAYVIRTQTDADGDSRTTLLRTTDAGKHLAAATNPVAAAAPLFLVFPTPTTGYAIVRNDSGTTTLHVTTDGARTWRPVRVPTTDALIRVAGHGGRVFAVTTRCHDTQCDRVRLWTSRTGATVLHAVRAALPQRDASASVSLAAWDDTVWVGLGGDGPRPVLARSTDGGSTLRRLTGLVALACDTTASSAHVVWSACRTGMLMGFSRSVDGREHTLPLEAAGTTGAFLQPVSDDVAWFGVGLGDEAGRRPTGLYRTTDGGRHFARVSPGPPGYSPTTSVTFLDATHALAADGATLRRTADGARTWQPVAV